MGTEIDVDVIYDVCHNIARVESTLFIVKLQCCVHRKGATRSFEGIMMSYPRSSGNRATVLVPGDMGTFLSWPSGPKKGTNQAFGSSCHGAGAMSRTQPERKIDGARVKRS